MINIETPEEMVRQEHAVSTPMWKGNVALRFMLPVLVLLGILLMWYLVSYLNLFPAYAFPSPVAVWRSFQEEIWAGRLINDIIASLWRVAVGFVISAVLGIPVGLWLGQHLQARRAFVPMLNFFRFLSPLAWIPFAILWFHIGDKPAIFLIFMATFFPLALATMVGVAGIPSIYFRVAQDYDYKGIELLTKVTFPAVLPQIITALRVSYGIAWVVIVAAEMVGCQDGLGYGIWEARNGLRLDSAVCYMMVIGVLGMGIDRLLAQLTKLPVYAGVMKDKNSVSRLVLQRVSHRYGSVAVLNDLNLTVRPGEVVVLVGPSGCGKTTILNLLSGHLEPVSGTIQREGIIRTVYQQDSLFPWLTVSENIAIGLRLIADSARREKELAELLELVHLEGFEQHYPHQLSGGMRQRAELARVLAGDSDILLMDEPFSALDYQARLQMRRELVRLLEKRPRTVVFVTHDIEEAAQLADRVLVLSKRPATICRELKITASRPRGLTDEGVIEAMNEILKELGLNNN